ncbi:CPBP family glutamic-type intramembrane protease [Lyngbya aestuarii]|uniref:CPBP family glutamic-type intramembrane protease n=1 Tax=Lyngbya aestuarii TaxID=118322 RepID=UPI00403DA325
MTIKRVILVLLTILAIVKVSLSLVASWNQPQIQSRLELYQTNLLLHAAELQDNRIDKATPEESQPDLTTFREALIGAEPFENAQQQYQEARQEARTNQSKIVAQLRELAAQEVAQPSDAAEPNLQFAPIDDSPATAQRQQLRESLAQAQQIIDELELNLGILQVQQGNTEAATKTWSELIAQQSSDNTSATEASLAKTAAVLIGLWSDPPLLLPDTGTTIEKNLESWFRYRSLSRLYEVQKRQDDLLSLQAKEQEIAKQATLKLGLIAGIPGFSGLLGVALLLFLVIQRLLQGKSSLLASNGDQSWETPWDWEIVWQVLIVGFFFIGQMLLPLLFGLLGVNPIEYSVRMKAFYVLCSYLLMAAGGLLVLYLSIKAFFPLSQDWFSFKWKSNWILWGVGGYLVALPLVVVVSLINQKLWQGQGGSNPLLTLALEGKDNLALLIFFLTASVAAPVFEEMIFRGFLLPSLTRYLSVWGAIIASALLFAIAHLSLSEVLPLATLGIVLGFVYTRSRNLLAPMLLHGLWNSGTLLSLFILGSGSV